MGEVSGEWGGKREKALLPGNQARSRPLQAVCISMSSPYLAAELGHPHTALPSGCPSLGAQPSFLPLTRGPERVGKICHLHRATAPRVFPAPRVQPLRPVLRNQMPIRRAQDWNSEGAGTNRKLHRSQFCSDGHREPGILNEARERVP